MADSVSPILVDDDSQSSFEVKEDEIETNAARETMQMDDNTHGGETDGPPTTSYTTPISKKQAAAKTNNARKPLLARPAKPVAKPERGNNRAKFLALAVIFLLIIAGFLVAYFVLIEGPNAAAQNEVPRETTTAPTVEPTAMPTTTVISTTPLSTSVSTTGVSTTSESTSTTEDMSSSSTTVSQAPTGEPTMEPTMSGTDATSSNDMDVVLIAAVAGGGALCLLFVICLCCCCFCKKNKNGVEEDDEYGQMKTDHDGGASELMPTTAVRV